MCASLMEHGLVLKHWLAWEEGLIWGKPLNKSTRLLVIVAWGSYNPMCRTAGDAVRRACTFLISKQREDGGWGEDFAVSLLLIAFHIKIKCVYT